MSSDNHAEETPQCGRCGGDFRLTLCVVHPDSDVHDRVEAHLCYDCRQDVTHRVIGGVQGS